ncbi:MAG: bifunctional DNA primase/polymerase, partial [Candidatus Omnitrophica bacterium]|nr:bifunctional DNA primase/polymerase [Candidatus Omnitrophota bacterium]
DKLQTFLDYALYYASIGWAVFPCNHAKKPFEKGGFHTASKDPAEIKRLFSKFPASAIGVATGETSGIFSFDVDIKNGQVGEESYQELISKYGNLPQTPQFFTWSGGRQYIFKYIKGINSRNSVFPGIDIKGDGGYICVPPSVIKGELWGREKEGVYVWELSSDIKDTKIAPAPQWLIDLIKEHPIQTKKFTLPPGIIPRGNQDNLMFRLACSLKSQGFQPDMTRSTLQEALKKCDQDPKNPFTPRDIERWISSAYGYIDEESDIITLHYRDGDAMVFHKGQYEFHFTNIVLNKTGKLKATLNLTHRKLYLLKTEINPSIQSHRDKFIKAANDPALEQILVDLEVQIRKQISHELEEQKLKAKQPYVMTDEERKEAEETLRANQNILYKIKDATDRMGVVGEETLRLMVYLCFTSRMLKEPLSMTVKGESSSGKSFSCQSVLKLIPEEGYHFITKATQQAFFHLPEDGLQHRIVYINEMQGSEQADYSIRTAQSEGDLILMMPIKDEATGNMETITKRVKGPVGFLITTTKANMFDENETRNFSVFSDDSPELTAKIGDITIRRAQGEIFELDPKEINLYKNIHRLLKPDLKVIIPYAKEVLGSFPDKPVRIRRDRERFRVLLNVITILHQMHRKIEDDKIYSTLADYHIAKILAEELLVKTIFETSPAADILYLAIKQMEEEFVPEDTKIDFTFTYQDVADHLGWDIKKTKKWLYSLIRHGIVENTESGGGKFKKAILRLTKKTKEGNYFLPEVEELIEKYPCPQELFYNPMIDNTNKGRGI